MGCRLEYLTKSGANRDIPGLWPRKAQCCPRCAILPSCLSLFNVVYRHSNFISGYVRLHTRTISVYVNCRLPHADRVNPGEMSHLSANILFLFVYFIFAIQLRETALLSGTSLVYLMFTCNDKTSKTIKWPVLEFKKSVLILLCPRDGAICYTHRERCHV
jgi:hypothetical protein